MTMDPAELERRVAEALNALPTPRAPAHLLARVMAAVDPQAAPIRSGRPWFTWHWSVQVAALTTATSLIVLATWFWPGVEQTVQLAPGQVQTAAGRAGALYATVLDLARAAHLVWAAVVAPLAKGFLMLTLILSTACALVVGALSRLALGGASHS